MLNSIQVRIYVPGEIYTKLYLSSRSFHRSLQSAAFLQILLMFVAIASRTGTLATEFIDILHDITSCTNRLISVTVGGISCHNYKDNSSALFRLTIKMHK